VDFRLSNRWHFDYFDWFVLSSFPNLWYFILTSPTFPLPHLVPNFIFYYIHFFLLTFFPPILRDSTSY